MGSGSGAASGDLQPETPILGPGAKMQAWSWAVLASRGTIK